ncbi:hypothetical protein ACFVTY_02280 [Streptomyces sp. NPDC058067]|uniref:hypothetical protein n=1 Tax=Streptomyces sp. NPDC058067 TaxID=3346324 RepID=UPI0036F14C11
MPPTPPPDGTARPAAAVNEEIRALVLECGGWLYGSSRDRYEQLVEEWAAAVRVGVVEAA